MTIDTVGCADTGIEETEIVIDFRHRPNRRARVFGSGFLVNGNSRAQALNGVNIRFFHIA